MLVGNNKAPSMMEPTEQTIGKDTFYIYPLSAFTAANLSGEVIALLAPLVGGIAGVFAANDKNSEKASEKVSEKASGKAGGKASGKSSLMDMDITEAAPYIAGAFSSLSPDKMEGLLRKLLLNNNVAVIPHGSNEALYLTEDVCNQIFCGSMQNMFILAFHVLKVNYKDFFESIGSQSGKVMDIVKTTLSPGTGLSTQADLTS